ncbi:MAG: hypothetical protein HC845_04080 [Akkermansiaceae bacterium]|nr:hypothetical protein [Akkermansiaceae bacterium]
MKHSLFHRALAASIVALPMALHAVPTEIARESFEGTGGQSVTPLR